MTCCDIRCIRASSFQAMRCQNHNLSRLLNNENLCSSWSFVRCSQKTTYDAEGYQKNPRFSLTLSWLRAALRSLFFNRSTFFITLANNAPAVYVRVSPLSTFHESNFYLGHRNYPSITSLTTVASNPKTNTLRHPGASGGGTATAPYFS